MAEKTTRDETESERLLNRQLAQKAAAETRFFNAHAQAAEAGALEAEIGLRAKQRVEEVVLAQNELHHVYVFDEVVNSKSVKSCIKQLTTWQRQGVRDIELQINSPGGSIFDGFALIDFIRGLQDSDGVAVTAVTYGMAASMGGVILQAASHRVQGANSFLLLHEGALLAAGDFGHVEDEYKLMKKLHERILDLFVSRAKVSKRYIEGNWKRKDWWLSADESLKCGFVDEVR